MTTKTVIHVYKNSYSNVETSDNGNYHGIGDFLRSSLGMYNLSKKYKFNLIVDYSLHPVSEFLNIKDHEYNSIIDTNKDNIKIMQGDKQIMDFIFNNNDNIIILSAWLGLEVYNTPISDDAKTFMKDLLIPSKIMEEYIDSKLKIIPHKKYTIIHYRLGDDEIVKNIKRDYKLDHIKSKIETNNILISDSMTFKETVKKNIPEIFMFDDNICHLGRINKEDSIQHTLFELLLMSESLKIKSYSVYSWESGFAKMISVIYNIPLESEICLQNI